MEQQDNEQPLEQNMEWLEQHLMDNSFVENDNGLSPYSSSSSTFDYSPEQFDPFSRYEIHLN